MSTGRPQPLAVLGVDGQEPAVGRAAKQPPIKTRNAPTDREYFILCGCIYVPSADRAVRGAERDRHMRYGDLQGVAHDQGSGLERTVIAERHHRPA